MDPHQFMQKVTLGTGLRRQRPWDLLPLSSHLRRTSTFQCSAICPAASLPALNPTGNLFPFNGFTVKWKAPGHKSSLGLEGVRIIVAIKRRALSLNIPMHSLFFFPHSFSNFNKNVEMIFKSCFYDRRPPVIT